MKCFIILVSLWVTACEVNFIDEFNDPLPETMICDPAVAEAVDLIDTVSFDRDKILCVGIEMRDKDFRVLANQSRIGGTNDNEVFKHIVGWTLSGCSQPSQNHFTYFEADVEVGGLQVTRAGIRKKGFLGSIIGNGRKKPSFKIKMNKFVEDQLLGDTERITLNNNNQDLTRINTCLSYDIFTAANYPAPRCNLANVMLGEQSLGVYSHVESIKKRFLRRAFGNASGSLYEGTFADFTARHLAGARVAELAHWEAKTSNTNEFGAPLLSIVKALRMPNHDLLIALEPVLNIDRFITFWALETLIAHTDGYSAGSNNFYVYFDPNDGQRATFIPWGVDAVLSKKAEKDQEREPGSFGAYVRSELTRRLSQNAEASALYQVELQRLLDEVWDEVQLLARIDIYADLVRSAERSDTYDKKVNQLRTWVNTRRAKVEQRLASKIAVGHDKSQACEEGGPATMIDLVGRFGFAW